MKATHAATVGVACQHNRFDDVIQDPAAEIVRVDGPAVMTTDGSEPNCVGKLLTGAHPAWRSEKIIERLPSAGIDLTSVGPHRQANPAVPGVNIWRTRPSQLVMPKVFDLALKAVGEFAHIVQR